MVYRLTEIGYDTSEHTEEELIQIAECHCRSYDDERVDVAKIDTLKKAIEYFNQYGFEVERISE